MPEQRLEINTISVKGYRGPIRLAAVAAADLRVGR